jgi:hypothetical protein
MLRREADWFRASIEQRRNHNAGQNMKLYVCWNMVQVPRPPRGHPCHNAYKALRDAGHDPDVIKVRGLGIGPIKLITDGRRKVQELTGNPVVPVLVTDEGEAIDQSQRIVEWAKRHPAISPPDGGQTPQ